LSRTPPSCPLSTCFVTTQTPPNPQHNFIPNNTHDRQLKSLPLYYQLSLFYPINAPALYRLQVKSSSPSSAVLPICPRSSRSVSPHVMRYPRYMVASPNNRLSATLVQANPSSHMPCMGTMTDKGWEECGKGPLGTP